MPYYDHNQDYPFAAFITNLGKYNEGELVGEWVKFPTTAEELKEVFKRIGIGQKDDFGQPYEEWFITDYDCYVDGLYSKLGEYENLDELNYLASKLDEMDQSDYAKFQAAMEIGDYTSSLQEIINLTENLDCYEIYPNIEDYDDLGRYYIEELDVMQVPEHRINLPTERSADNDVVIETKAWGNEDNNAPIISNSYTVSFLGKNTNYTLVVYGAAGQVAELQRAFQKVFPLLAFIVFCVSLVTGWIFSHLITKPVLKISRISKEMSELQFEWQLDEQRTDELGILAKSLNYLSQKLNVTLNDLQAANRKLELDIEHEKALEQARTNFFSAVSHELKTPITIIKGQLEGMLLGIGPYKDHERYLTRSLEITNTLETMVQDILTISRLETAGADFKKDHLDCVQIIKAYLNETADLIAEKDLQIHLDILPSAFINGNKMLVEKVFSNLIGNAIKYSPQRADIWISVLMKHEQIVFSVENAGVHIPENSIPRLFDAFYRVEQSRSRKTGGSGLGLYIVQEILHQYGSECTVCNTQAGVKFSFII